MTCHSTMYKVRGELGAWYSRKEKNWGEKTKGATSATDSRKVEKNGHVRATKKRHPRVNGTPTYSKRRGGGRKQREEICMWGSQKGGEGAYKETHSPKTWLPYETMNKESNLEVH